MGERKLTHLKELEAESIHILREVVAEFERPVMLYSIGKDSSVMLRLAMKAFYPGKPPFPFMHIDTTWKFREMIEFRERRALELGIDLIVYINEDGVRQGIGPFTHGSKKHTDVMKTDALKQALDAALAEAKKIAKPGEVDVQTGNFSLYPRYTNPGKGGHPVISAWQGSAELGVQGKDIAAIAQLSGRIQTMTVARVGYTLSREAREKVETEVTAQAIARWRAKAAQMSLQFGYSGYSVREVNVATNDAPQPPVPMLMRATRASSPVEEALPTEAGKGEVTANVSGAAQMTR